MEIITNSINHLQHIYLQDRLNWDIALGAMALMAVFIGFQKFPIKSNWGWESISSDTLLRGRGRHVKKARRDFIRKDTIDALVHHVEKRVYDGDYSRKEANELYREARKAWYVKDLFPSPILLKEAINKRLKSGQNEPVPLPGSDKPKRKNAFDKPAKA